MKKQTKLKLKRKILPGVIIGGLGLGGIVAAIKGYSQEPNVKNIAFSTLLLNDKVAEDTRLDEFESNDNLAYDYVDTSINYDSAGICSYVQAADRLEMRMNQYDDLNSLDLDKAKRLKPLSKKEEQETIRYMRPSSGLEFRCLKAIILDEDDLFSQKEKDNAMRKLYGLKKMLKSWIRENGQKISLGIMKESVYTAILDDLDGKNEDYGRISFKPRYSSEGDSGHIDALGKTYDISDADCYIKKVADYIYMLDSYDKIDEDKEFDTYRKSIGYAKVIIASGIRVDGNELEIKKSKGEVNKILSKEIELANKLKK